MKYSKEQILEKSKKIMKDLQGDNFDFYQIETIFFTEKDELARPKGKIIPAWTVAFDLQVFDTTDFLIISDETGEPLYIQSKHLVMEIMKDADGKYVEKK